MEYTVSYLIEKHNLKLHSEGGYYVKDMTVRQFWQ